MAKGSKGWWNHGESNLGPLAWVFRPNGWTMVVEAPTVVLLCNSLCEVDEVGNAALPPHHNKRGSSESLDMSIQWNMVHPELKTPPQ